MGSVPIILGGPGEQREDLIGGGPSGDGERVRDPDVVALLATAQGSHGVLRGHVLDDLLDPVSAELLRDALLTLVPGVIQNLIGDERNSLLTLARIVVTVETGQVVSKDAAARAHAARLTGRDRVLLERARAGYLGFVSDDWSGQSPHVRSLARTLAEFAEQAAPGMDSHAGGTAENPYTDWCARRPLYSPCG